MRDPSAIDYSEPIFDWLRNSKDEALKKWECIITGELQQKQKAIVGDVTGLRLPHFKAVNMHMTRFCDLKFRLGAGYLYCHQVPFSVATFHDFEKEETFCVLCAFPSICCTSKRNGFMKIVCHYLLVVSFISWWTVVLAKLS